MVGTAVYQVGVASSIQPKNFSALKPGVQNTCEPADSGASTPAIRPWMWNSGMMFRPRSAGVNCSVRAMLRGRGAQVGAASAARSSGREVVPEVCSTIATSSGCGVAAGARRACGAAPSRGRSVKLPAGRRRRRPGRACARPACCATSTRRRGAAVLDDQRLGVQVRQVELELVGAVGRVQRRAWSRRRRRRRSRWPSRGRWAARWRRGRCGRCPGRSAWPACRRSGGARRRSSGAGATAPRWPVPRRRRWPTSLSRWFASRSR